jgi:hypothetical protein
MPVRVAEGAAREERFQEHRMSKHDKSSFALKLASLIFTCSIASYVRATEAQHPVAAVVPPRGAVSDAELKTVAIEVRAQLRHHGYRLAIQKYVRDAVDSTSEKAATPRSHLEAVAAVLGVDFVAVPVVSGSDGEGYFLEIAGFTAKFGVLRALKAKLPARGAGIYSRKQVGPAVTTCVAELLNREPPPIFGPPPAASPIDPMAFLNRFGLSKPKPDEAVVSEEAPLEGPVAPEDESAKAPEEKSRYDWNKWDHKGIFTDFGFIFSWCRGEELCEHAVKGFGARFRIGYRIESYVALSVAGVARDHQMPITTDAEVFLNVQNAFVFAGVFGGIRYHPVRRFVVDPFVGIDFGYLWLLHASNKLITESVAPAGVDIPDAVERYTNKKRTTLYLRGFTVAPEFGFNVFMTPAIALGVHAQWAFPFWKKACARVTDPTNLEGTNNKRICVDVDKAVSHDELDEDVQEVLSDEDTLPRFIGLEVDLIFVFK